MKQILVAAVLVAAYSTTALAQGAAPNLLPPDTIRLQTRPLPAPPANLLPERVGGMVFFVNDLETQRTWYETVLGMKVVRKFERDGKLYEYVMGYGAYETTPIVALLKGPRPEGANAFARLVLRVPDPGGLANFLFSGGVAVRQSTPNMSYVLLDPEGNQIEISKQRPRSEPN